MESLFIDVADIAGASRFEHPTTVLVLPYIDQAQVERLEPVLRRRALCDGLLVLVNDTKRIGFMAVANLIFSKSSSRFFGYLAQDAFPSDGWLKCGVGTLDQSGAWLLAFNDGRFFGNLAVFGLLQRAWAQRLYHKCVFFPGYASHFGDTELSAIAMEHQKLIFNPACVLCEVDYEKHARKNNPADEQLYRQRARTGFGGVVAPFEPE